MREILFRAKRIDNGEWAEGYYQKRFGLLEEEEHYIFHSESYNVWEYAEIDKDTICQYMGLTDKNGQKIWEHDIVRRTDLHLTEQPSVGIIEYDVENTAFLIHWIDVVNYSPTYPWKDKIEVIGNVFDNPVPLTDYISGKEQQ